MPTEDHEHGDAHRHNAQAARFDPMLRTVLATNQFYRAKFRAAGFRADAPPGFDQLKELPFTTKHELVADQAGDPPFGSNLTYPLGNYTRVHQTSGTTGHPLRWLDTADSWRWWLRCWREVYAAAEVTDQDRIFVAFSFGPFIGFWSAFEAGQQLGAMMIAGGGLTTEQRLESMSAHDATVLVCTPTYALRLAEAAAAQGRDLAVGSIRTTIHAGEPGASIPGMKARLESTWGARCVDHAGATELGAWGYGCGRDTHVHILEEHFVPEVVDPGTEAPATPVEPNAWTGELVLTNLGRWGSPVIRYRTGDLVTLMRTGCACGRQSAFLAGGVRGRVDDMIVIRGINVFPSALENVIRELGEVREFEVRVGSDRGMSELRVRIEADGDAAGVARLLETRVHDRLQLRPQVEVVPLGSLPRYEHKARRFVKE